MDSIHCSSCNRLSSECITTSICCQGCPHSSQSHAAYMLMYMKKKERQQTLKTECFEDSSNRCMLTNLSDTVLLAIASYLEPPDVHRLAQTCKQFHTPSTELSTSHCLSPPQMKPLEFMRNNEVSNLASKLLQESLVQGVSNAIQTTLTTNEARRIVKFQEDESRKGRKVLLTGSAVVQAVTGKRFEDEESDLNFVCDKQSASGFRQLMRDFSYCCESVVTNHCDHAPLYHYCQGYFCHVETFIPAKDVATLPISTLVGEYYRAWNARLAAEEGDEEVPQEQDLEHLMSFFNDRNEYLYDVQKHSPCRFAKDYPIALTPPKNFSGLEIYDTTNTRKKGTIQLVVCASWADPMRVIANYDFDICKSIFDGKRVHIVSINDAFNLRTKSSNNYMKFVNTYVPHYLGRDVPVLNTTHGRDVPVLNTTLTYIDGWTMNDIFHIISCVSNTARSVDRQTQLTVLGPDLFTFLYTGGGSVDAATQMRFILLHNNVVRLLRLALKYYDRGIDVPLSEYVRVRLGHTPAPAPKRRRHCDYESESESDLSSEYVPLD